MEQRNWVCPKCSNTTFETDAIHTTGGKLAKLFDVQNKRFTAVTCTRCKYTELYKGDTSTLENVFDFFTN